MPIEADRSVGADAPARVVVMCVGPAFSGACQPFLSTMQGTIMANPKCQGLLRRGGPMVLVLGMLIGCSGDDLGRRYRVSGHVTRKGQPVTKGTVNFMPVDLAKSRAASGEIQSDGSYTLTTQDPGDGALAGDYRVVISLADVGELERTAGGMPILNEPKKVQVKNLVPPKYSDPGQTVLKCKVEPHSNTYDIDMTE
jgi:hypothetical protein